MKPIFNINGLVSWEEQEILIRENLVSELALLVKESLSAINRAWSFHRTETPILTPTLLVLDEYAQDTFQMAEVSLRPETTKGSYAVAWDILESHNKIKLPLCVWQAGKSFRREQDKTLKNMRLKEFWQLEFQCIYSKDTGADYKTPVIHALAQYLDASIVPSDRLPSYSIETTDLEINGMEVASVSTRVDFSDANLVLEIAIGLDRLVYQRLRHERE